MTYHFCYMTTMTSDNAEYIYFGKHSTSNLDDGYNGSGKFVDDFKSSSKFSKDKISTKPLCFFETAELALEFEELLIDAAMPLENCVNMKAGGKGGWAPWSDETAAIMSAITKERWENPEYKKSVSASIKNAWADPVHKAKMVSIQKERNKDPELRKKKSEIARAHFDLENYSKCAKNPMYEKYEELYELWVASGKPSYATFHKVCIINGYEFTINNCRPIVGRFKKDATRATSY